MDQDGGDRWLRVARRLRREGRLEEALSSLPAHGDPQADGLRLQLFADLDDNERLQDAVRRSIKRLPEVAPAAHADYLTLLCRQVGLSGQNNHWQGVFLARTAAAAAQSPELRAACEALRRRRSFAQQIGERFEGRATLISLGLNCMPWTLPNRWGLRSPEAFVSDFTPFAYGVHKMKMLYLALESDFEGYLDAKKLMPVETKGGHLMAMSTDLNATWNHNLGPYWLKHDFRRLREAGARKADNFRRACRADDAVFLIGKAPIDYPAEPVDFIDSLNGMLEPFTGRPRNRLVLWNEYAETAGRFTVDPWTVVLNCPYPSGDYIWYDDESADSPDALAYEQSCAEGTVDRLCEWGLLRPRPSATEGAARAVAALD